jgi:chaperone modulatory protein CbpM
MKTAVMRITVHELCERQGLSRNVLLELVEHDIARPVAGSMFDDWVFDCGSAHWLDIAVRLRRDLDLDWIAVAMLVDLLRERETLDAENRLLRQRLERFLSEDA